MDASATAECPPHVVDQARRLNLRAASLREQAETARPPLALAYKRRAAELDLEAWALRVRRCEDLSHELTFAA